MKDPLGNSLLCSFGSPTCAYRNSHSHFRRLRRPFWIRQKLTFGHLHQSTLLWQQGGGWTFTYVRSRMVQNGQQNVSIISSRTTRTWRNSSSLLGICLIRQALLDRLVTTTTTTTTTDFLHMLLLTSVLSRQPLCTSENRRNEFAQNIINKFLGFSYKTEDLSVCCQLMMIDDTT